MSDPQFADEPAEDGTDGGGARPRDESARDDPRSAIYDEDGALRPAFMDGIETAVEADDATGLRMVVEHLHQSELGDVLEALPDEKRQPFVDLVGDSFDYGSLVEVDEAIRMDIVDQMESGDIADAIRDLDSDEAVFILEDLEEGDREDVLRELPFTERIRLRRALDYPEESAGRRMQTEFIAVPPFWSVGQAIDFMREAEDLPDRFPVIFCTEPTFKLAGVLPLDVLLRARRPVMISDIMETEVHAIPAEMDQEEAAAIFDQYDLLSAPVVDENQRLVGVLTVDDVIDIIQQESAEDIKRLAGVGDEELSDRTMQIARSRFPWLLINLGTAILASVVIGAFEATIQQMVALAVLMPIVASMGGNAATQTMTVAVRALATRDLDGYNARRIVRKELTVGLMNGVAFALVIGLVAAFWFTNPGLGVVIGVAMVVNMLFAAASGILIPIVLDKFDADPAISSGVFVTTVTDVVGFFAFLGLAGWWFGI